MKASLRILLIIAKVVGGGSGVVGHPVQRFENLLKSCTMDQDRYKFLLLGFGSRHGGRLNFPHGISLKTRMELGGGTT